MEKLKTKFLGPSHRGSEEYFQDKLQKEPTAQDRRRRGTVFYLLNHFNVIKA